MSHDLAFILFTPKVTTTGVKLFFVLLDENFEYPRYRKTDNRPKCGKNYSF
jgi:hypothetical protein